MEKAASRGNLKEGWTSGGQIGCVKFDVPIRFPGGDIGKAVPYEFLGKVWAGDRHLGVVSI